METQIISPYKAIIFKKYSKRNQNHSRYYYNSVTNLKFQHKPKLSSFKNPHTKIDLLPSGKKSLKLLYSIMNLNTHNILALAGKANKQTLLHHEGWMVNGQETLFCWVPVPLIG